MSSQLGEDVYTRHAGSGVVRELFRSLASSTAGDSPRERQSRAVLLRKMLERGVSPDARDPDDKDQLTLLISAAYYADLPLVRLLLESGADVHLTDASGGTALMSAALTLSLSESSLSESAAAGEVVAILLRVGARLPAELPPGAADRGWGAQWTAMHKSVSEVAFVDGPFREAMARGQPRIQTPRGDVIMKGQKGHSLRQFRAAPDGGPDLDKPRMEHILGGSAQERVVEFLQQHERQARREAAGAESPASRPSASSSALAVILALLLVAVVSGWRAWRQRRAPRRQRGKQPAERAFRERARRRAEAKATAAAAAAESAAAEQAEADGGEGEGQQTGGSPDWVTVQHLPQTSTAEGWRAREPLSDPDMSDGASEAGLAHGGRPTPSAPPDPEILSLAAATFDTGRRDAPESTIGGETTCIVCFTRPKTHAALPCGHQCVCAPCSARLRACPYCRTPAERWWHVRVV